MYRNLGFGILTALLILMTIVAIITYTNREASDTSPLLTHAIHYHVLIMIILVVISVAFGFVWSSISLQEIDKKEKEKKNITDVVLLFLGKDERSILDHLIKNDGSTSQAEIARLGNMGRVRAFRSLQKLQEKRIIEIHPHGKMRKITLCDSFKEILLDGKNL
jgi:uncharacterized membrane protein